MKSGITKRPKDYLISFEMETKMTLKKRGKYYYGDSQADIRDEVRRYSKKNAYVAEHFADAVCTCGKKEFQLLINGLEGAAVRTCAACRAQHPIGDSEEFLDRVELEACSCVCGHEEFQITVGVSLYEESNAVRWLYLGCRCPTCGLTGVYGDWKNEFENYRELLARV
jgi:hypothetical protein